MKSVEKIKILVVGDIMLDRYVVGDVSRISPEAPVAVVNVIDEYSTLGGSGNVVRNIRETGAQVDCLSSIGGDIEGKIILDKLKGIGVKPLLCFGSERTTAKERIIAEHRSVQMLRIDREVITPVPSEISISKLKQTKNDYDIIIVSDYNKGMITSKLMTYLKENMKARIIVDPKPINGWMYNDIFMITPNEKEWQRMQIASNYVLDNVEYILQTLGSKGMRLIHGEDISNIKAVPVEIYNVSGAGDTVIAMMAVCLSMGLLPKHAAEFANQCAGYVVTQPGTSVVPKNKFMDILSRYIQEIL